ncbi:MAG: KpsF/GutQ family sugar-phosphate isomerase [Candidatus Firestonebacteria bacterium]|nr:KpsF/GutQ family sugar-phosphate isomerase [Candidatus Firestonebacteria bacterium]
MARPRPLSPVLRDARRVLRIEAKAITQLEKQLGTGFERAVELMRHCRGRVVVTGLGKSGVIGQKIAATLASTGTPSIFIHSAEAVHGDLGKLIAQDVVVAISNSGQTEEIIRLLPQIKRLGVSLIAMTGKLKSPLAINADVVLNVGVREEACPLGLAPTASTTAVLAMGDALAVAILNQRKFKAEDFAHLHPGGALGKSLVKVRDIMHTGARLPKCPAGASLDAAVAEMTRKKFGCVGVVGAHDRLLGIFTDGDLRRLVGRVSDLSPLTIGRVMTPKPMVLREDELAIKAARIMQDKRIFVLLAVDARGRLRGVLHFLDLLDAGVI